MLHFQLDMPLHLMTLYGSVMIVLVLLLRCFLRNKLPKFVFPALWSVVLLRLLVPFSLSSPISAPVPPIPPLSFSSTPTSMENAIITSGTNRFATASSVATTFDQVLTNGTTSI